MKTTILLFGFFIFSASLLQAQIEKGRVQIGGYFLVDHQKKNSIDQSLPNYLYTDIFASPSIGKFYNQNKLIGAFLDFGYFETSYGFRNISRSYGGGLFLRQYQPLSKRLYILFDERASFDYLNGRNDYYIDSQDIQKNFHGYNIGVSAQAGMAYDIAKRMQLELLLNNLLSADFKDLNTGKVYSISSSLDGHPFSNMLFGFRFYLN